MSTLNSKIEKEDGGIPFSPIYVIAHFLIPPPPLLSPLYLIRLRNDDIKSSEIGRNSIAGSAEKINSGKFNEP